MRRPVCFSVRAALALAIASALAAGPALAHHNPVQRTDLSARGWPIEDFSLTDQHGKAVTQQTLQGRWTFVLLGDTHSDPSSQALGALAGLYRRIAPTEALKTTQVLFVSLDPQRDTPARLQAYLVSFDARFLGASAAPDALRQLVDDLRGGHTSSGEGQAGALVLVGPDGTVRAQFLPPFDVDLLTAEYLKTRVRK